MVNSARAIGPTRRQVALQFARPTACGARRGLPLPGALRRRRAGGCKRFQLDRRARRRCRQSAVRPGYLRLLSHESDRARLSRHGRMFGSRARRSASGGGIVSMSTASPSRPSSSPSLAVIGVAAAIVAVVIVAVLAWLISGGYFSAFGHWMHTSDVGTALRYLLESLLLLVCVLLSTANLHSTKSLGSRAAETQPQRGWTLRHPSAVRGFLQVYTQRADHPGERQQGRVPACPARLRCARLRRVGGHSGLGRMGGRGHQRWAPLSLRGFLAWRVRRHHGGVGVQFEICAAFGAARSRPDGVLRGLDRLRDRDGGAVRRLGQSERHRPRPGHAVRLVRLVLAATLPDVHCLLCFGACRDEIGRHST